MRLAQKWKEKHNDWGKRPVVDEMEHQALGLALESGYVEPGETVIVTAGVPLHVAGATNLIKMTIAE